MIKIENVYYMITYAFRTLGRKGYKNIQPEKFETIQCLLAELLHLEMSRQIKLGLAKDYQEVTEALIMPRGKINLSDSIKQNSHIKKKLICNRDEYLENTLINQIVKSTIRSLLFSTQVAEPQKQHLKKLLFYFDNVNEVNLKSIKWSSLRVAKHHSNYRVILAICEFVSMGYLLTEKEGTNKVSSTLDDQALHTLYERFVLEYFKKHHPQVKAASPTIDWDITAGESAMLPRMKTDITLTCRGVSLIIDTKFYSQTMQTHSLYGTKTIHSNNLYQLHTYVTNKAARFQGTVEGMLLYAKTNEDIVPNQTYFISGNKITVTTLDLSGEFHLIKKKLDAVAEELLNSGGIL